uniref:Uncharacterized protein n=1 Tax=Chenopodium quinoa TaxID=63459 RepID=A0A803N639_CHEQI
MILEIEKEKINPKEKDIIREQKKRKGKGKLIKEVKTTGNENFDAWVPDIGRSVHDITNQGTHCQAESQGAAPQVIKCGGFVDLLRKFKPRTYNIGNAANATDSYKIKYLLAKYLSCYGPVGILSIYVGNYLFMEEYLLAKYLSCYGPACILSIYMMVVIVKEKAKIVGKAPPAHVEMVEIAFDRMHNKIDRWGTAVNQMWRLISNFLADFPIGSSEDDVDKPRRKKGKAKSKEEEDEYSDYDDEDDTGAGDYADNEEEVKSK